MSLDPKERARQVRDVLDAHPSLPIMVLAPSVPTDYDSCYHDVIDADVQYVLQPDDVHRANAHKANDGYVGLDYEKFYTDEDDAVEDVSEWLFDVWYNEAIRHGMPFRSPYGEPTQSDALTEFCGASSDMGNFSDTVARAMVRDMPWREYVIIYCY